MVIRGIRSRTGLSWTKVSITPRCRSFWERTAAWASVTAISYSCLSATTGRERGSQTILRGQKLLLGSRFSARQITPGLSRRLSLLATLNLGPKIRILAQGRLSGVPDAPLEVSIPGVQV